MIEGGKLSTILVANKGINVWSVYSSIMWDDKRWWMGGGADTRFTLSEYILILCKIQVRLKPIHAQYHLNTLV